MAQYWSHFLWLGQVVGDISDPFELYKASETGRLLYMQVHLFILLGYSGGMSSILGSMAAPSVSLCCSFTLSALFHIYKSP